MSRLKSFRLAFCTAATLLSLAHASNTFANADYGSFSQLIDSGPNVNIQYGRPLSVSFIFTDVPLVVGDGPLTVTASGDIGGIKEYAPPERGCQA